jgi:hypothetical protein
MVASVMGGHHGASVMQNVTIPLQFWPMVSDGNTTCLIGRKRLRDHGEQPNGHASSIHMEHCQRQEAGGSPALVGHRSMEAAFIAGGGSHTSRVDEPILRLAGGL